MDVFLDLVITTWENLDCAIQIVLENLFLLFSSTDWINVSQKDSRKVLDILYWKIAEKDLVEFASVIPANVNHALHAHPFAKNHAGEDATDAEVIHADAAENVMNVSNVMNCVEHVVLIHADVTEEGDTLPTKDVMSKDINLLQD